MSLATDPYSVAAAVPRRFFLHRLNPLAKAAAPLPAIVLLVLVRDVATPLALGLLALVLLLAGTRLRARSVAALLVGAPLLVALLTVSFGVWTDPATVADTPVVWQAGALVVREGALLVGLSTGLRLCALVLSAFLVAAGTEGPALVRALVAQLRVPYRFGYAALAAFRFVPRFKYELDLIRQAHRVRGTVRGRGPIAAVRRGLGYVIPLLAGAIRHAERVALAMDSRAFGAYPTRTERHPSVWRARDTAFTILYWAATAAIVVLAATLP